MTNIQPTQEQVELAEKLIQWMPIDERLAIDFGVDMNKHRCGCEVCAKATHLCPATQSSIALEVVYKIATLIATHDAKQREVLRDAHDAILLALNNQNATTPRFPRMIWKHLQEVKDKLNTLLK